MIMRLILFIYFTSITFYAIDCRSIEDQSPNDIYLIYNKESGQEVIINWWTTSKTYSAIVYYDIIDEQNENYFFETGSCNHKQVSKGILAQNDTNGRFFQKVHLRNIKSNKLYCYEIVSGDTTSHINFFRAPGETINDQVSLKNISSFLVYGGDTVLNKKETQLFKRILNDFRTKAISGVIKTGDIQLTNKTSVSEYSENIFSNLPLLSTIKKLDLTENSLEAEWPLKSLWFSYNLNGMHFISISTDLFKSNFSNEKLSEKINKLSESQLKWLEEDLFMANENRFKVPWIVATTYHPLYISAKCENDLNNNECFNSAKIIREKIEKLFFDYGVDLVISSSKELYERSWPVAENGTIYEKSYKNTYMPVYVNIPRGLSKTLKSYNESNEDTWSAYSKYSDTNFSYGYIDLIDRHVLRFSFYRLDGTIIDNFEIEKDKLEHTIKDSLSGKNEEGKRHARIITLIVFLVLLAIVVSILLKYTTKYRRKLNEIKEYSQYVTLVDTELNNP